MANCLCFAFTHHEPPRVEPAAVEEPPQARVLPQDSLVVWGEALYVHIRRKKVCFHTYFFLIQYFILFVLFLILELEEKAEFETYCACRIDKSFLK